MNFAGRYLADPVCVFKNGVEHRGSEFRFRGLRESGPYDSTRIPNEPRFLFVFPQEFRPLANTLYHGLRSGNNQFPGMAAMFGVNISPAQLKSANKFTVDSSTPREASKRYHNTIREFLESDNFVDFAIVLCHKTAHYESPSAYYASKAALASRGIPSQVITVDTLSDANQLSWSIGNIALQIFVKLGGQPWFVRPSAGGGDIIVGIGRCQRIDERGRITRYVGYTTAYDSGGVFKSIEVFAPQNSMDDYLAGFESSMVAALKGVIGNTNQPLRLVLHVPKTFSFAERHQLKIP